MSDLKAAAVLGIGAVTACGRGLVEIPARLGEAAGIAEVRRVEDKLLTSPEVGGRMRRADRFVKMAVLAAMDAWKEASAACQGVAMERVGLIVASGLGPHGRGFRFLDGILDCGDEAALPTDFSHSVHGAAAAYIAEVLGLRGPAMAVTDFENGFGQAVLLAQMWLAEGRCERVIVGAVEEVGEVMLHCVKEMAGEGIVAGEGAVFLVLGGEGEVRIDGRGVGEVKMVVNALGFAPWFGRSASGGAFGVLARVLAMRESRVDSVAIHVPSSGGDDERLILTRVRDGIEPQMGH